MLAFEFSASYGEMSRRSGEAAKADNHSDISPLDSRCSLRAGFLSGAFNYQAAVRGRIGFTFQRI
jgi:hypothetical protein